MIEIAALESNAGLSSHSSQLHSCGESSEEELSVLPRHTKVVVTGNNRTKSVLVGLQGVVKKAVGLGGWHWLVLTNGIEVKLQRNALSVIEAPTGNEEEDDLEFEHAHWNGSDMTSDDTQKSHRSRHRTHRSSYGLYRKTLSRSLSSDSHSKDSVSNARGASKVDLSKLEMAALWRYLRHFNLADAIHNPSKEQVIDVVQRHFMSQVICRSPISSCHCIHVDDFSQEIIFFLKFPLVYVAAYGRAASDNRVCASCKETENSLQMTNIQPNSLYANKWSVHCVDAASAAAIVDKMWTNS